MDRPTGVVVHLVARPFLALAAAMLMLAACSSDGGSSDAQSTTGDSGPATEATDTTDATDAAEGSDGAGGSSRGGSADTLVVGDEGPVLVFTPSTSRSLVVGTSWFLGGWDGSTWVRADRADPTVFGAAVGDSYQVVEGPTATGATVTATDVAAFCDPIEWLYVDTEPQLDFLAMGIAAPWNVQPRDAESLANPGAVYQEAAADFLAEQGYTGSATPQITQWFRVDLEGDGVDEVVMTVESGSFRESGFGTGGDFAGVLLRKVVVNEAGEETVQTSSLGFSQVEASEESEFGFIEFYDVIGFADLNGDTRLEILVASRYYEGASSVVFEYTDPSVGPELVLAGGCGA